MPSECLILHSELAEGLFGAVATVSILATGLLGILKCCRVTGPIGPRLVGVVVFYYFLWTLIFGVSSTASRWGDLTVAVVGTAVFAVTSDSTINWPIYAGVGVSVGMLD